MRSYLRSLYLDSAGFFSRPTKGVHILNGHFYDTPDNSNFVHVLKSLRNNAEFLGIDEASAIVKSGDADKFDGVGVAFTFDDGFLDCYDHIAPSLSHFNVNACFFVNPGFVDGDEEYVSNFLNNVVCTPGRKSMTWAQVKELSDTGFVIGNHTFDHKRLVSVSQSDLTRQIVDSKNYLQMMLGRDVDYFAWPYGQMNDIDNDSLSLALTHHKYVYSGSDFKNYLSFGGSVINRRHYEPHWKLSHLKYFLSHRRKYQC
ncbi:MAG: polysaccharide deacetylase family protein [Dechloromonas sp.]|nr:polysaccharide deacetylase family protein [Dechloromonas sp.]